MWGWVVAVIVLVVVAWVVAICYEIANPGKLNWNQPYWWVPRRRAGEGSRPPRSEARPPASPGDARPPASPGEPRPRAPGDGDHRSAG